MIANTKPGSRRPKPTCASIRRRPKIWRPPRTQQLSLIQQAEAKVASANAEQLRASQQVNRISQLNQRHYSSQDSLDEVRAGLQVNQAQAREAQAALQAAP